jgi:hypothetical protein
VAATLWTALPAAEAGTSHATLTLEQVHAAPGETASLAIVLNADDLVGAIDLRPRVGGLTIVDVLYDGPLFSLGWNGWDSAPDDEPFIQAACIFPEDQVTGLQYLVHILVEVPATAKIGASYPAILLESEVRNYQFTPFEVTVVNGGITVTDEPILTCAEDVMNHDSVVNTLDLLALLAGWGPCGDVCPADIDHDGSVGIADLLALLAAWGPCD